MPVPSLSAPARNASMDAIRPQGTAQQAVQGTAQRRGQGTAQPLITTFRNKSLPIRSRSLPLFIRRISFLFPLNAGTLPFGACA